MYKLPVETINGIIEECVYNPQRDKDIYKQYKYAETANKRVFMNDHYEIVRCLNIPCAFDIETTNVIERDEKGKVKKATAFMYQWQFCIDDKVFFCTALASEAHLVTGNLKHYPKTDFIVTPAQFCEIAGI